MKKIKLILAKITTPKTSSPGQSTPAMVSKYFYFNIRFILLKIIVLACMQNCNPLIGKTQNWFISMGTVHGNRLICFRMQNKLI